MLKYYFQSFNLQFKGCATREEYRTVILIDMLLLVIMGVKLYLLNYGSSFPYLNFASPLFAFFYPARRFIFFIVLAWFSARYAAWQALAVRRVNDLGIEVKWLWLPSVKFRLFFQKGGKAKT